MPRSVTFPAIIEAKILAEAKANRRSFSAQVVYMCEKMLNAADSEQGRDLAAFIEAAR